MKGADCGHVFDIRAMKEWRRGDWGKARYMIVPDAGDWRRAGFGRACAMRRTAWPQTGSGLLPHRGGPGVVWECEPWARFVAVKWYGKSAHVVCSSGPRMRLNKWCGCRAAAGNEARKWGAEKAGDYTSR